jgi:hypothetical protein
MLGNTWGSDAFVDYLCCMLQARNVAITVRTIIVGLMYLATFIFSANALGLTGGLAKWLCCENCLFQP